MMKLLLIFSFAIVGLALECYDNSNGKLLLKSGFNYCMYSNEKDKEKRSLYGINNDIEDVSRYDNIFRVEIPSYYVKRLCIEEVYLNKYVDVRCFCNRDRCNLY